MKAPDIVESWKWRPAEEIIERLLALSARTITVPIRAQSSRPAKDKYYLLARRCAAMREARFHVEQVRRDRP